MYYNIFDSHAHYDVEQFDEDRAELLESLPQTGVCAVMNAATNLESSEKGIVMAQTYPWMYTSVGIHPEDLSHTPDNLEEKMAEQIKRCPKIKAVGEIGLDYYYNVSSKEEQIALFRRQVRFAVENNLPVIVHDRDAHADTLKILQEFRPKGIVHCYSGSKEMAVQLLNLGLYLGFTGVITFRNAKKPLEALREIPVERLLLETDCPYMAPEPLRGKRSDSSMIAYTAQKMAEVKEMDTQALINTTFSNACRVFGIEENNFSTKL